MVRQSPATGGAHSRSRRTSRAPQHGELVVRLWQRRADRLHSATSDRNSASPHLRALCRRGVEQPAGPESRCGPRLVHPRDARLGIELHGGDCPYSHDAGLPLRGLQISPGAHLDHRRFSIADDPGHGFYRTGAALRSGRLLGTGHWRVDRQPYSHHRSRSGQIDAGRADHSRRDSIAIFHPPRLRDSGASDRLRRRFIC